MSKRKIVVAITGASGSIYAKVLLEKLALIKTDQLADVGVVMSDNAKYVWRYELGDESYNNFDFSFYSKNDFMAPFASGSAQYDSMIVCPCSMGTLARIATGTSSDLTTRAADVILKERRKLVLVTRETPLNLIHINNMAAVTQAGGIICPASPSFYSLPQSMEDVAATVVDRVLSLIDLKIDTYRWGDK
ncbi:MAG TPA: UbiX family flavin prenyltransferase [Sphingobacterium bovisgrunnientis]|jgi:4-hydroxy-3-polyprenylbenzoate decarboxylase|uniref:UbiX family flavin prenyltransferase n=1 Tax=Sphingobacterium bovisgrunnientis TaxID=1874697 RepID=UPI0013595135|nr:UbiX family flavin prenyltransferase [Sphingobacterium bovisgrunnientis]HLS38128.1 UbiX family flavin prenyltransferase [Sphingobacterium bovisgrunnientis]